MTQVFVGSFQPKSSLISKFPWLNLNFNFSWSKPNCHRTYTSWAFTMSCTGAEWCWSCGTSMDLRCWMVVNPNWKLFQSFPKKEVQAQSSKFSRSFVVKNPSQIPTFQGWEEALHGLDPEQLVHPTALPALDVAPPVAPPPSPSPSSAARPRSPYLTSQRRRAERMPKAPWAGQRDHWGCWMMLNDVEVPHELRQLPRVLSPRLGAWGWRSAWLRRPRCRAWDPWTLRRGSLET